MKRIQARRPPPSARAARIRSRLFLALILLACSWGLSLWSLNEVQSRLIRTEIALLLPQLPSWFEEENPIPELPEHFQVQVFNTLGQQLKGEAFFEDLDLKGSPEWAQAESGRAGLSFRGDHLYSVVLVGGENSILQGYIRLRVPAWSASSLRSGIFWVWLVLLGSLSIAWLTVTEKLYRPRRQLIQAVGRLQAGERVEDLFLPSQHPFRPVADHINNLSHALEGRRRILTEQHHQQQILLNNMTEGILVLDREQRITALNPLAAEWLAMGNPLRCQGRPLYTLCRNPDLLAMVEESSHYETFKEAVISLEREEEEDRIVLLRGAPLVDRDQTLGSLILLEDITRLRHLETLRQDFVANVSHELRTPLAAIMGFSEFMEQEEDAELLKEFGMRIQRQSRRMMQLIDDLLELTRMEHQEAPPPMQPNEIRPLMEQVFQLLGEAASQRGIDLVLEGGENLFVEMYPPTFEQALSNLVANAIKYTDSDTRISLRAIEQNDRIRLEVEDEGPGIAPIHQSRIFERFYRIDKARSRAVGGTGLGLSIVKHIVQLHHGEIGLISKPGEGCLFWIELPLPGTTLSASTPEPAA